MGPEGTDMARIDTVRRVRQLKAQGFDQTYATRTPGVIRPACSQCQVLVINGTACHETGCPHATTECHGCSAIIPARQRYCADCAY